MICHAKLVSMLPVPCIILSYAESNAGGYSQMIKIGTILLNVKKKDWQNARECFERAIEMDMSYYLGYKQVKEI